MRYVSIFVALTMMLSAIPGIVQGDHTIDSSKNPQFLFVLSAKSGSFEGDTLTLKDVPLVIYFSERPDRIAGHMSLKKFVDGWNKGSDSFKSDPPNATLSIFNEDGNKNVVVELLNPQIKGDILSFKIRLLEGSLPKSFDVSSLFIDDVDGLSFLMAEVPHL